LASSGLQLAEMIAMKIAAVANSKIPEADLEQGRGRLAQTPIQIKDEGDQGPLRYKCTTHRMDRVHPRQVAIV